MASRRKRGGYCVFLAMAIVLPGGCFRVGPNFSPPPTSVSKDWLEASDRRIQSQAEPNCLWWQVFSDPALDRLIETACRQNLSLGVVGVRVLEARAQLGIATGEWYPQNQQAFGSLQRIRLSANGAGGGAGSSSALSGLSAGSLTQTAARSATAAFTSRLLGAAGIGQNIVGRVGAGGIGGVSSALTGNTANSVTGGTGATGGASAGTAGVHPKLEFSQAQFGATASWELDFWGKYRRGIESAEAALRASLAEYDNALVSLTGDVASSYIQIRTLEQRLIIARQNVVTQQQSLQIAEARFHGGTTTERDVQQARTVLLNTQATIPVFEYQLRQSKNALSLLLGMPPDNLTSWLKAPSQIPVPPPQVAVGIPADLLRRRPDVRSAEFQAAAQSAQIGVAKADLLPAFSLTGTFGFQAAGLGKSDLDDLWSWHSRFGSGGPGVQWSFLNYGQITNNVRLQDARFQELLITYQNTVLTAQREVEDALVAFLQTQEQAALLAESTQAAHRSLELAMAQYRQGTTDFTTVLSAQQALLSEQDNLAITLGSIASNLVALYRALGGGWEIRNDNDVVSDETKCQMAKRTDWGNLLEPAAHLPSGPVKPRLLPPPPDW